MPVGMSVPSRGLFGTFVQVCAQRSPGMNACGRLVLLLAISLCGAGCSFIDRHATAATKSPLGSTTPSPDSVTLEILFVRAPIGNGTLNQKFWNYIDEQRLSAELRRTLTENGIRTGVVCGQIPDELAKLMTLTDKPTPKRDEPAPVNLLEEEPNVTMRLLQARAGHRNEVICSGSYEQLPLLERRDGQVRGHTFLSADGRMSLKSFPTAANEVDVELVPEIHHGEKQPRWVGSDGVLRLDAGKPREVYDWLRMRFKLSPGEMLVMTNLPDRPGSLGHYFFTQPTSERTSQKLLIIRLSQECKDSQFFPTTETPDASPSLAKVQDF